MLIIINKILKLHKNKLNKYFNESTKIIFKSYLLAIIIFTIFRIILLLTNLSRVDFTQEKNDLLYAFLMGLRFDIVISGYLLILPFLFLTIASYFTKINSQILKVSYYLAAFTFTFAFLICAIDIPFFNQFFSRLSITVFEWINTPAFVFKMIFQEPRYWLYAIPYLLLIFIFFKVSKTIFLKNAKFDKLNIYQIITSIIFLLLMILGIRGRIDEKSPIRVGTAYFSNNPFLNQLGLNPNFTFIRSYLDAINKNNKYINLIEDSLAIQNVQKYLNIKSANSNFLILRKIDYPESAAKKYNVVIIIMESMSAEKMSRNGCPYNLTPFLDSISYRGIYFSNAYTAGIHTMNGIFSTLFGFPALFRQHPMNESSMQHYQFNIFSTLKHYGYSTIYFTTHDGQFDNVEGFLKANDCEKVITKSDYPDSAIATTLGVPDDFMFQFSIPILTKLSKNNKPFLSVFMTASDHGPYYIPKYFQPKSSGIKNQIVEYADYSLKKFIDLASKQSWFKNTIFVFVADHGAALDNLYDMSLSYHHTPLLFYSPTNITNYKTFDKIAGQIDIYPTIMGLLQLSYNNNTLGIDLFEENRPYIYFNADNKYGVLDSTWFLIARDDNTLELYKYREKDKHNYVNEAKDIAEKMNIYAKSNLQTYQYLLKKKKL